MVLHAVRMIDETAATTTAIAATPLTIVDGDPIPPIIKCTENVTSMSNVKSMITNNNNRTTTSTSAPMPPSVRYNKPPIYTSDKRAKFTQRENKKWIRLATVIGYLISVCMPAVALSIYYIGFWNPQYDAKFLSKNDSEMANASQSQQHVSNQNIAEKHEASFATGKIDRILVNIDHKQSTVDQKQCSCVIEGKTKVIGDPPMEEPSLDVVIDKKELFHSSLQSLNEK